MANKIQYKAYLHSEKESNWDKATNLGLDENDKFMDTSLYSLYEVQFDMEVDPETGESWILGIAGVKLEYPVKA